MRPILHAVGVLPLLLMSTLATPDLPIEKNGRSLTPAIESEPQISDVTITARDLFSRQSCSSTEEECSGKRSAYSPARQPTHCAGFRRLLPKFF